MVSTFTLNNVNVSAPVVEIVPATSCPPVPADLKAFALINPDTLDSSSTYPVLQWNGYTYWALSHVDNRVSFAIVAYDSTGKPVQVWAKPGARYIVRIEMDAVSQTVKFVGQSNDKVVMSWEELWVAPQGNMSGQFQVPLTSITGTDFINTYGAPLTYTFSASGNWKPAPWADCTLDGWKDFSFQCSMQYPDSNSFALLAVKKPNHQVVAVGGSEFTIVLQPDEILTFLVNDIPSCYDDNTGSIVVSWSAK